MTTTTDQVLISDMPVDLSTVLGPISPGFDWKWSFFIADDNQVPTNTTGWNCILMIRETQNGPVIATLSTTTGEIVNNPSAGRLDVNWAAAKNASVAVKQIVFDVKTIDSGGGVSRPFKGSIPVDAVVTR